MCSIDVIKPGMQTMVQDYPGRQGYWAVGVPPSGPMDNLAFQFGNQILGNDSAAAGLEITLLGPKLAINVDTVIALVGAPAQMIINGVAMPQWRAIRVNAGSQIEIGTIVAGARAYLCFKYGLDVELYLGSRATFALGKFGGHLGRVLQKEDQLTLQQSYSQSPCRYIDAALLPVYSDNWTIRVLYGPQGAPDFFTPADIEMFFAADWTVHHNSDRTGVRLLGPKPDWAREDGGEAGLHPSNLHDNPYAVGAIDFTGDMPVILGPDGPSLGGFVCPATIINADLWKIGQLKAGSTIRFVSVSATQADMLEKQQQREIDSLTAEPSIDILPAKIKSAVLREVVYDDNRPKLVYRRSGQDNLLIELGEMTLDIALRLRIHALMDWIGENFSGEILDLTPGIRSLQIHFDSKKIDFSNLMEKLCAGEQVFSAIESLRIPSRRVHLPLSWNDSAALKAVDLYMQSVRNDAPWCPDNIEFIRRINGLDSIDAVKDIVFGADYLVMGLGDVYLGAPVATPLDPRHRLVTTKYNPARTWTPENAVGIGGAYLCVYGMEGPGGYQFVGRTVQMWNRGENQVDFEPDKPWLLRFFDQIRFFPVDETELVKIREDFPAGNYHLKIEDIEFDFAEYQAYLTNNDKEISLFQQRQKKAFEAERARWVKAGELKRS